MGAYRHAQGLIGALDRGQDEACPPSAENDWCNHHVQAVEAAGGEKTRHSVGATLNQHTAQAARGQRGEDRGRSDMPISGGQSENFNSGRRSASCCFRRDQQTADAVVGEHLGAGWKPPIWVYDDARRLRSCDPPHGKLRIIGERRADANDDRIDQGP